MRVLGILLLLFVLQTAKGVVILDTLYINRGSVTVVDYTILTCVFNDSANFHKENKIFELNSGDQLLLHVINNDVLEHTFTIDGMIETGNVIPGGGSDDFFVSPTGDGVIRFYSDRPYGKLLGASSIILVGYENHARYYWNLFDQQDTLTDKIDAGTVTSIPLDYMPDIFNINMEVGADLMSDTLAYILQSIGDTVVIAILNSGNMHHNIHFHGFHVTILSASENSHMTGWIKDSLPLAIGETMLVMLVPDQEGMYMAHNHNLITVTTNGVYLGGMMQMMMIMP